MVFVCFLFICHALLRGRAVLSMCCVTVNGSILMRFSIFLRNKQPFQMHYRYLIFVARWLHNVRDLVVKK